MGLFENIKGFFRTKEPEIVEVEQKENEEIARIIQPVFREIPPESKAGKFLTQGFRSWAFIAVSAIADEVCTTPLQLFKQDGEDWTPVERHPAVALIDKPNAFQTKEDFLWLTTVYWLSEGEAPIYINNPKNPTEMVLLNPERLTINFDEKNIIGGYKYRQSNGTDTIIPAENLIMLRIPSVVSPFRGTGIMKYISQTLDIDNYIEEYLKLFFFNDTTPGATLETDQELTKTIIERLKMQFTQRHQGVKNSHKLAVLEKGMKYHKISSNINELQLKELNDLIRDKILAAFKVPKSVLGIVEDVNRANAEASSYTFSKRAVMPKLKMIESQFNQFLLPKFTMSDKLWFEFESPVFEDKVTDAQVYAAAIQNGWMTVNEVREEIGLEPLDEEDMQDEEEENNKPDEEDDEEEKPKKYVKEKRVRKKERPSALVEIMKDIIKEDNPEPKKFYSENELEKYHQDKLMFLDFLERDFISGLKMNFRRQKRKLLKQIEGKSIKANDLNLQLDVEDEALQMVKVANPYLYEAILKESELTYALLGLQGRLTPQSELVKRFVEKRTLKLGKETTETTQKAIDRIIKEWGEKQGSWTDLRDKLTDYFDGEGETGAKWRADMIARTELSNATGFAQQEVYKETGAIGKQWLTATDERVCPICDAMNDKYGNGMTVSIMENFFNKGDELPDGTINDWEAVDTPPLHPNCRCDIIPVYAESRSALNGDKYREQFKKVKVKCDHEHHKKIELEEKEKELTKKELALIEKEQEIAKTSIKSKKELKELEKTKKQAEAELKKVEEYNKNLNG